MRIADVTEPQPHVLLQAAFEEAPKIRRHAGRQRLPVRLVLQHRDDRVGHGGTAKCARTCEHLVDNAANAQMSARLSTA